MNKTTKVYISSNYKKNKKNENKKYENHFIKIPKEIAKDFCLKGKQEVFVKADMLSKSVTFSLKPIDVPDYATRTERLLKEDGRKGKKGKRKKIESGMITKRRSWISVLEDGIKSRNFLNKRDREIIKEHKEEIKKQKKSSS